MANSEREFCSPEQLAAAKEALTGLLTPEQQAVLRERRQTVGSKRAVAIMLDEEPRAYAPKAA